VGGWIVIGVAIVVLLLVVAPFLHMGWRLVHDNEEFVAGGSMGHQMTTPVARKRRLFRRRR
jgi:hypothetical protein